MSHSHSIRHPAVAGMFYPGFESALRSELDELFENPAPRISGTIVGIIAPHAGYRYSGITAAIGYGALKGKTFDAVFIVSPSHREAFGGVSVYPGEAYRTPLGDVKINKTLREELLNQKAVVHEGVEGHRDEHAVEVQLPFLQTVLGEFSIVPLVMGLQNRNAIFVLADQLAKVCRGKTVLIVASSDLSHYHSYETALKLDTKVAHRLETADPIQLWDLFDSNEAEACGAGPMVSVVAACVQLGAKKIHIADYRNSGDVSGDRTSVVGYLSALLAA